MLAEDVVRNGDFRIKTIVDHSLSAGAPLFVWLEQHDQRATPRIPSPGQQFRSRKETCYVHVMSAGMHNGFVVVVCVSHSYGARVGEA